MATMKRKVILTGGAGHVGLNLTPLLLSAGWQVVALDKNRNNLGVLAEVNPDAQTQVVELDRAGSWQQLFEGADAVVDLHAQIAAKQDDVFRANNVEAERNVVEACRAHAVEHLVHLSSSVVISVADDEYTRTKREAEEIVTASGLPYTVLRPPLLYGLFDQKHLGFITRLIEKAPVVPIPGHGRYARQPLYTGDLCAVIVEALTRGPEGRAWNVIGHEHIDFIDLLKIIAEEKRLRRLFLTLPVPLFRAMLRVYGRLLRKPMFTDDQLAALTAGDDFEVDDWAGHFGVSYTPYREALKTMYASPLYDYRERLDSPH